MKSKRIFRLALLLPLAALVLTACGPKSPEERVAKRRSHYEARMLGFIVEADPVPAEPSEGSDQEPAEEPPYEESMDGVAADVGEGEGMETDEATVSIRQNVRVDILLQNDSPDRLAGITLDIEMVDSSKVPKMSGRFGWIPRRWPRAPEPSLGTCSKT